MTNDAWLIAAALLTAMWAAVILYASWLVAGWAGIAVAVVLASG